MPLNPWRRHVAVDERSLTFTVRVDKLLAFAAVLLVVIIGMNLFMGLLKVLDFEQDEQPLRSLTYLFDVGEELAVVAWISTLLLASASLGCWIASQHAERSGRPDHRRGFRISAAVLAYISLDEATMLHERTTDPLRDALDAGGLLYWTWVLPAMAAVTVVVLVLARFVFSLREETKKALIVAGALFVSCAIGLELLEGYFFERAGAEGTAVTDLLSLAEETGEIIAVVLALWAVVRYSSSENEPAAAGRFAQSSSEQGC